MSTNRKTSTLFRRAALMLLLALTGVSPAWADQLPSNMYILSYAPDPRFHIPSAEKSHYGYSDYRLYRYDGGTTRSTAPRYKGYTFQHFLGYWTDIYGVFHMQQFGLNQTISTDITYTISHNYPFFILQAVFDTNHFTVKFHANGGTGTAMPDMPMKYDTSYALPACTYSKAGHTLIGWTTEPDGSGEFFYDKEVVHNITEVLDTVINLYAQYNLGDGSAHNPYLIDNASWDIFAARVNKGVDSYKYYKMTSNIYVVDYYWYLDADSRMMGTQSHPFNGHFDGDGHSIHLDFHSDTHEGIFAPFPYVKQATFRNLNISGGFRLEGYISCGGLVGAVMPYGTATFVACHSKVYASLSGGSGAGFIADVPNHGKAVFIDCLSSAEIKFNPTQLAYFVGIVEDGAQISFTNCLESSPKYIFYQFTDSNYFEKPTPQYPFICLTTGSNSTQNYSYTNCWRRMSDAECPNISNGAGLQGTYTSTARGETIRSSLGAGWVFGEGHEYVYTYYDYAVPRMPATTHSITVSDMAHGTVECLEAAATGLPIMLEVIPEEGYHIVSISYNDGSDHTPTSSDGKYWFTMPNSNVTVSATFALNDNVVPYIAYNTETRQYETRYFNGGSVTNVTSSSTTWGDSAQVRKYVVTGNITDTNRIYVNGTVHLVLADGATLTATKGINVCNGNSLIVYGQQEGTGTLNATGSRYFPTGNNWESAAIGSDGFGNGTLAYGYLGDLTFHSGVVNATAFQYASAIGGGHYNPACGSITIYGGTITATATVAGNQEAIGHGASNNTNNSIVGKTVADGLRVYTNYSTSPTLMEYAYRIQNGLSQKDVRVQLCTEHNYQNGRCTYCGAYQYHQITYNGNGNTGGTVPAVATCNVTTGIYAATGTVAEAGTLERTGYTFAGWNTEADGSGTAYAPGETINLTNSITLYAQWDIVTYTITYDLAGGYAPTLPNPETYTIESDDITLNKPTRIDINGNDTTNYLFMGWTGTDLGTATREVAISHGSTGDRTYTATWDVNDVPFEGIEIDHDFQANEVGRYYIIMPAPEHPTGEWVYVEEIDDYREVTIPADLDFPIRTVNIPAWFTSTFKVYDNGGKNGDYLYNTNDSHINTLILIAPEGKIFNVQGGRYDISIQNFHCLDRLTIYDGATTTAPTLVNIDEEHEEFDGMPFVTTGNIIRFDLFTDDPEMFRFSGLNLTVTITDVPTSITLANDDSQSAQTNTSVIASNDGVYSNVTLDGRTLYRDGTWNTLCLPFDIDDISVTSLRGATIKALTSMTYDGQDDILTMNFGDNLTSMEAGKPYIVKWDLDASYNVIDGTEAYGELSDELVDGSTYTQWYPDENDGAYCIFEASEGTMSVTGYTITTAWDNPRAWTLEGKMSENDEWTLIDSRNAITNPADALPDAGETDATYSASHPGTYRYFRFTVTTGVEVDDEGYGNFHLAELTLQGVFTPDNIVNPTFNYVTISDETHPSTSGNVTFGGNYSTFASTIGRLFDEHNTNGNALRAYLEAIDGNNVAKWYTDAVRSEAHRATTIPFDANTGNVTLYATWGLAEYPISYNLDGGSVATPNPTIYTAGTATFTLNNPTRENYTFVGWSGTGINETDIMVTIPQGSTGERTYTATWMPVNFSITSIVMAGDTLTSYYNVESDEITLDTPMRSGYTFDGWYTNSNLTGDPVTIIAAGSTGNKEFWAKWTPEEYYIGYHLNGGTMPNGYTMNYTIESADITLPTPTREGYSFGGWYSDSLFVNIETTIATGSAGFKEFWAKWQKNLTITANSDSRVYDGTALTADSYTATGLVEGDILTATVTITGSQTNVGTSDNVVTAVENVAIMRGEVNVTSDYLVVTENGTLEVTPKDVTVTAADQSKNYGDADPTLTATVTGLIGEDAVTYNVSRTAGENAGTYDITPTGETAQGNYAVAYIAGTLTISPINATVTITGHNSTVAYDGTEHSVSGYEVTIVSPILYTESDFTFSGTATAARTDAGTTNMGLSASDFSNTNANFATVTFNVTDGYQTVTAKVVDNPTIELDESEFIYDGTAHEPGVTVKDGETVIPAAEFTVSYSNNTAVGIATVTVSDNADGNYSVSGSATFVINARTSIDITTAAGWQAISSPVYSAELGYSIFNIQNSNLTTGQYDMFRYNESLGKWENQKARAGTAAGFTTMEAGRGYLYRRSNATTLVFNGQPNSETTYSIDLTASGSDDLKGFNLVGNPYPFKVFVNRAFYELTADGSWLAHLNGDSIAIGQGILVHAIAAETLTFYAATHSTNPGSKGYLPPLPGSLNLSGQSDQSDLSHQSDQRPFAYQQGNSVVITLAGHLEVYDALGRRLFSLEILNSQFSILNSQFPTSGVYILRLGEKTQKIVIKK